MFVKINPQKRYGDYFLVFEAEGDEPQAQDVRSNMKQINLKPNNRARIDFRDGAEDPPEPETPEPDSPVESDVDTTSDEDFTNDNQDTNTQEPEETPDTGTEEENNPEPAEANPGDETPADATGTDEPDTGGDENFTDDGGTTDTTPAEGDQTQTGNTSGGPGLEYDSTRQYKLFLDYEELYNSVENYISNLESEIRDDKEMMSTIRVATDRLRKISELLFDYMTLKFSSSTYIQNLLFYQKMYTAVELLISMLSTSLETKENNN